MAVLTSLNGEAVGVATVLPAVLLSPGDVAVDVGSVLPSEGSVAPASLPVSASRLAKYFSVWTQINPSVSDPSSKLPITAPVHGYKSCFFVPWNDAISW